MPGHFRSLRFFGAAKTVYSIIILYYRANDRNCFSLMTVNDRVLNDRIWKYIHHPYSSILTPVFTILGKNEIKLGENYCVSSQYFVSLHRQSKETPYVPDNGHLLRPRRGINDGRRRSSMTTQKRTRNGAIRGVAKMNLFNTNDYD